MTTKLKITWHLEKRKVKDLFPYHKNPREFTEKGLKELEKSIKNIGLAQPININTENVILSGHARVLKLKEMGIEEVDCYVPNRKLTKKEEEEIVIRMNANIAGEWNFEILEKDFEIFDLKDFGMEDLDFGLDDDLSDKNKEIDLDSLGDEGIIKLKFNHESYLDLIDRMNKLKEENDTNESLFLKMIKHYESKK